MLQFSPFVTDLANDEQNLTSKNRDLLTKYKPAAKAGPDSIDFTFFADVHFDYKALREVVNRMNNVPDLQFAVCGGDITDQGLLNEYRWFHDEMEKLQIPYFTVIGNHDYRADGEYIYDDMFGARNYTLEVRGWQLVFFDDVTWEKEGNPDFEWLANTLIEGTYVGRVLITHLAPNCPQFSGNLQTQYEAVLQAHSPTLILCGHNHSRELIKYLNIPTYIETRVSDKAFSQIRLYGDGTYKIFPQ